MNENINALKQEIENLKSEINVMRESFRVTHAKIANHEKVNASLLNNNIDLQSQMDVFMQKVEEAKQASQKKTEQKDEEVKSPESSKLEELHPEKESKIDETKLVDAVDAATVSV